MSSKSIRSRRGRAAGSHIESLEDRRLLSGDPLAYQNVVQTLPYVLDFSAAKNGVFDNKGIATGFTLVQPNKNMRSISPPSFISIRR